MSNRNEVRAQSAYTQHELGVFLAELADELTSSANDTKLGQERLATQLEVLAVVRSALKEYGLVAHYVGGSIRPRPKGKYDPRPRIIAERNLSRLEDERAAVRQAKLERIQDQLAEAR